MTRLRRVGALAARRLRVRVAGYAVGSVALRSSLFPVTLRARVRRPGFACKGCS